MSGVLHTRLYDIICVSLSTANEYNKGNFTATSSESNDHIEALKCQEQFFKCNGNDRFSNANHFLRNIENKNT